MRDFEYLVPEKLEEACKLLSEFGEEAKVIAGGQSLLIFMKQRLIGPSYLIDIKTSLGKDLSYITFDDQEGLRIGALATHRDIEKSPVVQKQIAVLAEMEQQLSDVQIRNWGTIGGNLCHGDPAGDPAPVLIALKAVLRTISHNGERSVPIENFFKDYYETTLQIGEILTEIKIPKPLPRTGIAYMRLAFMRGEMPMVSTAVSVTLDAKGSSFSDARIALGAVGPTPIRAKKAERVLIGEKIRGSLLEEVARIACEETRPISDFHASEEYKRWMVEVLVKRTIKRALERAK